MAMYVRRRRRRRAQLATINTRDVGVGVPNPSPTGQTPVSATRLVAPLAQSGVRTDR